MTGYTPALEEAGAMEQTLEDSIDYINLMK